MKFAPLITLALFICSSCSDFTNPAGQKLELVKVLVVAADRIPANQPLHDDMLAWIEVPQSELLWDSITRKEDFEGKALNVAMTKGEMITKARLINPPIAYESSPEEIAKKLQGKTVLPINPIILPSQQDQVRPGSKVDVYAMLESETELIVSQIEVFSIDRKPEGTSPDDLHRPVGLLVDKNEAQSLVLAMKDKKLFLDVK